ncbi:osmoprotectant transport system substrate-binding protein [Agrococcus baldri]|uniref:Osmoprotectant transport system substrate-binding protein n=1 Tax=Agrococcus baldri TaxID=153730 RepID=A0AA94HNP5_9MICO|nr:ABC transporter substrate-binding protein [Agrococcus baldri]SFS15543.1 osmoprotectant transport system substrate-binding protein [Agrococcus baldri]
MNSTPGRAARMRRTGLTLAAMGTAAALLAGCSSADPLDDGDSAPPSDGDSTTLVVGSQDYYSNEIIAELYAQALEADGYTIDRQLRIGQREVYMPEIESGAIDLFPEYSGPLLQYWEDEPAERTSDEVYDALVEAAPEGLTILDQAPATDQDSYVVTREFAEANDLTTVADLANVEEPLTMGANSEAETRPNGPQGLAEVYGIEVGFTPIEDGGGPLTIQALRDGDIQLAIVYTADPTIAQNDLVVLEDTEGLFLASNVVPIASDRVDDAAQATIDEVSAALTAEALIGLNRQSVEEQSPAADIAQAWLEEQGLLG